MEAKDLSLVFIKFSSERIRERSWSHRDGFSFINTKNSSPCLDWSKAVSHLWGCNTDRASRTNGARWRPGVCWDTHRRLLLSDSIWNFHKETAERERRGRGEGAISSLKWEYNICRGRGDNVDIGSHFTRHAEEIKRLGSAVPVLSEIYCSVITMWSNPTNDNNVIKSIQWETKDSDTDLGFKKGTYYLRMTMIFYRISPIYLLYIY